MELEINSMTLIEAGAPLQQLGRSRERDLAAGAPQKGVGAVSGLKDLQRI